MPNPHLRPQTLHCLILQASLPVQDPTMLKCPDQHHLLDLRSTHFNFRFNPMPYLHPTMHKMHVLLQRSSGNYWQKAFTTPSQNHCALILPSSHYIGQVWQLSHAKGPWHTAWCKHHGFKTYSVHSAQQHTTSSSINDDCFKNFKWRANTYIQKGTPCNVLALWWSNQLHWSHHLNPPYCLKQHVLLLRLWSSSKRLR